MTDKLEAQLESVFESLKIDKNNIDKFIEYIEILSKWNRGINLISKKEYNIVNRLIAPSLLFFKLIKASNNKRVVDIGSGAGFPAMVIKIYNPSLDVVMVEKNRKKITFLHYVSYKLNFNVKIVGKNIFDIDKEIVCNNVDVVTARGVNLTKKLTETIKIKTRGRYLMYFTSPKISLPLEMVDNVEFNSISVQLYKLTKQEG